MLSSFQCYSFLFFSINSFLLKHFFGLGFLWKIFFFLFWFSPNSHVLRMVLNFFGKTFFFKLLKISKKNWTAQILDRICSSFPPRKNTAIFSPDHLFFLKVSFNFIWKIKISWEFSQNCFENFFSSFNVSKKHHSPLCYFFNFLVHLSKTNEIKTLNT